MNGVRSVSTVELRPSEELDYDRRVDEDRRASRPWRTIGATGGPLYGSRCEIRAASSTSDGLLASSAFASLIMLSIVFALSQS
jgi:hypothetical protein